MLCFNCFKEKKENEITCPHCGYTDSGEMDEHYYLPEGTILHDRYTIGRVLGHGGFGITYVGHDNKLDILVAIKEYLPTDVASRAIGETTVTTFSGEKKEQYDYGLVRFLDEAKTLARYNQHPCIVSTTDFFETNNTAYLVMEFLDGIALNEYLKRKGGSIPWEATLEIMMPVMDALREVHKSGMIHRDISPDNIYITKTGQVKLLDFGAARFALGEKSKSLSVVLKPGYAPPEQYSTRGKQGPWTDVYAVAATMYKMLTGEPMVEAMDRSMDDYYKKPSEFDVAISQAVEVGLVKALEFRPENRWQTIEDLQKALVEKEVIEAVEDEPEIEPFKAKEAPKDEIPKQHYFVPAPKVPEEAPVDVAKLMEKEEKRRIRNRWLMGLCSVAVIVIIFMATISNRPKEEETAGDFGTVSDTASTNTDMDNQAAVSEETIDISTDVNPDFSDYDVLNWGTSFWREAFDPNMIGSIAQGEVASQMFEGLVRECSGIVYPGMAESWEISDDGLEVTFHLRDDLKWSDGSALTADDFVYSWLRAMNPDNASDYSWIWSETHVVGAEAYVLGDGRADQVGIYAPNDLTLVVELTEPTQYFVSMMSFYHFMPVKASAVATGEDWSINPSKIVCNGPFIIESFESGSSMTLKKNPYYWNFASIDLDEINVYFADDADDIYRMYQTGLIDLISSLNMDDIANYGEDDVYQFPLLGTYYYTFNMDLDMWADKRVRQAFSIAIDREGICEELGSGQIPATSLIPPDVLDNSNRSFSESGVYGISTYGDIEFARALLEEAGYPNGQGFPKVTLKFNTSQGHLMIANKMKEAINALGIEVELESTEWADYNEELDSGDFVLARGGYLTDFTDPIGLLQLFTDGNYWNKGNYDNSEFDQSIETAKNTVSADMYYNELYKAFDIFMSDYAIIPIYHYTATYVVSDNVIGWDRSLLGQVDFTGVSIAE